MPTPRPVGPPKQGEFVTIPGSPFQLFRPYPPAGDQPEAIDGLVEGVARRPELPDAARRHRLGQDLHDGQRDRAHRPAGDRVRAEQDAGRAALRRVPRVLPEERGRVLRQLLRLLPARGLRAAARPVHREGQRRSTSTSSRCACRRPRACSSGATSVIVATVSAIYGIGDPEDYTADADDPARAATSSASAT